MSTDPAFLQHNESINNFLSGLPTPGTCLTYKQLSTYHLAKLTGEGRGKKSRENEESALSEWLEHKGLTLESTVGDEFGSHFEAELESHLNFLRGKPHMRKGVMKKGLADGTIRNRKYALSRWQKSWSEQAKASKQSDFSKSLSELVESSQLTTYAFAKAADVPYGKLVHWLANGRPSGESAVTDLQKIERYCGLPHNTLVSLAELSIEGAQVHDEDQPRSKYSLRQRLRVFEKYKLHKFPSRLQREFQQWYDLMTPPIDPEGHLRRNGQWFVDPDTDECPTGKKLHNSLAGFFGYLTLPVEGKQFPIYKNEKGKKRHIVRYSTVKGEGRRESEFTLALLGDITLVRRYVEFMRQRAGSYNEETLQIISLGCTLLLEDTGFVRQQPEYGKRLSPQVPADNWDEWCDEAYKKLKKLRRSVRKSHYFEQSRDVEEPIDFILNDERPIHFLFELTALMEAKLPPEASAKRERALAYRNMFLARLITANPLRIKHFANMTWRSDNTGNLYQDRNGVWHLRFLKSAFKNGKSLKKKGKAKHYDAKIAPSLRPYIEEYLFRQRPLLLGADRCDYVFRPGMRGGTAKHKTGDTNPMLPSSLSSILWKAARKYLRCMGFGSHAYRHIIATDYIKNHENGIMVAAAILHDTPETVLKHYGHYQHADFFRHWIKYHEHVFEISKSERS